MRCPKMLGMSLEREDGTVQQVDTLLVQVRLYDEQGTDTGCDFVDEAQTVFVTLYASHWPNRSVEDHFAAALKLIVDRFPITEEAPLLVAVANDETGGFGLSTEPGETLAAAFITEPLINDNPYKTALWLNETGGWHIKARATYPQEYRDANPVISVVEMVTATYHAATYGDVDRQVNAAQTISY